MTKVIKSTNPFVKYKHLSKMFLIMTDICKKSKVKIYLGFSNFSEQCIYIYIYTTFDLRIYISQLAKSDRVNISPTVHGQ